MEARKHASKNEPLRAAGKAVAMVGTFDVANYGDLLFPLIAAEELAKRPSSNELVLFSPNAKGAAEWPFEVQPTRALSAAMPGFAGLLIGGGQIVRFDDSYPTTVPPGTRMPIDYWLVPALLGAIHGKPVFWNAVGAWTHSPEAAWLHRPVREVFAASRIAGIRDQASIDHLRRLAPHAPFELVPDTAFGLARLWPLAEATEDFERWRTAIGLDGPYAVVQGSSSMRLHQPAIERQMKALGLSRLVVLPVCLCHGDSGDIVPDMAAQTLRVRNWPHPMLIAQIIARADFLFASSLHACITALAYGVPAARVDHYTDQKFELLDGFEGVVAIGDRSGMERLAARGRHVEAKALDSAERLAQYWDRVVDGLSGKDEQLDDAARVRMLDLFIDLCEQQLPASWGARVAAKAREPLLNAKRRQVDLQKTMIAVRRRAGSAARTLFSARSRPDPAEQHIPEQTGQPGGILSVAAIDALAMNRDPYRWGFIDGLFSPEDALKLARSFPRDRFRRVAGHDGEKGYEYLSRSLVHMGARTASSPEGLSPEWRALVADLLSSAYREAVMRATGLDLSDALMEVNAVRFGPGAWLGPHVDLKEKIATHILYFNEVWEPKEGGCLQILNSSDELDRRAEILPLAGNSALLVRSDDSWHAVSRVSAHCTATRRNINVIFHLPGSVSTMWPPGEKHRLETCAAD